MFSDECFNLYETRHRVTCGGEPTRMSQCRRLRRGFANAESRARLGALICSTYLFCGERDEIVLIDCRGRG